MKTLAQGQRGVLRNQLMAWAKSPLGRGDDLPLSKLAAHGKSILTECDADGGERRPLPTAYLAANEFSVPVAAFLERIATDILAMGISPARECEQFPDIPER